ncbi:LysR family transcriptional regulator [Kribbella sp. NPDC056951]|uniref:LysR family transcriptional regulator n=1 Tax=Kribbella sp. NPDC056951 TaxID=3345978 RepID=UPI0036344AFF
MELDLAQVRAFVVAAEELHFGHAAERLAVSQQAVSKRVAKLEESLATRLFDRGTHKVELTAAGARFLPHAIEALAAADAAIASVVPTTRTLRLDVLDERLAPLQLVQHAVRRLDDFPIEVSMRHGLPAALPALRNREVDAAFGRVHALTPGQLAELDHQLVLLEPLALLVSREHPLADAETVTLASLREVQLWAPLGGAVAEWADYLAQFAHAWQLELDTTGPALSLDYLVDEVAARPDVATPIGARMQLPPTSHTAVVYLTDPTPVYPWSLVWRDEHPLLPTLLESITRGFTWPSDVWLPEADRATSGRGSAGG